MGAGKSRAQNTAERQGEILAATLALFAEGGLAGASIAAISARSGASVGSIYHHFGDREGVLYALYRQCFAACFAELKQAVLAESAARSGIIALVDTYLSWIEAQPDCGRFMYEASGGDLLANHRAEVAAFKAAFYADIMGWLAPHVAAGAIIALPPWAYDVIVMGPAHEFARRWLAGLREMPMAEARVVISEVIWRAVQPQKD
ncbi:MAG: TetR/AcrR family transcriptional regulator, partial [Anaerolineales bacterium]|nr:TetR/AcrR family transcriptional regulator [Anaerolineales bacterium]